MPSRRSTVVHHWSFATCPSCYNRKDSFCSSPHFICAGMFKICLLLLNLQA
ncbi:hypothetical protein HanIR_Chr14g0672491 [Helianthus annuus]|nr:hypothetical protein HanIR_Chr14g0672491 [Helianthus annuus]